ncbi:hypothetical protein TNCV_4870181 [Trichonephila clavipes]|nr:hypothetical protein TNCV_4870181 [Trichonephila clavipes]
MAYSRYWIERGDRFYGHHDHQISHHWISPLWSNLKELVSRHEVTKQTDLVARLHAACTSRCCDVCNHPFYYELKPASGPPMAPETALIWLNFELNWTWAMMGHQTDQIKYQCSGSMLFFVSSIHRRQISKSLVLSSIAN